VCQQAYDFGTAPIHPSAMASFQGAPLAVQIPPDMLQPPSQRQIGGRLQQPFHFLADAVYWRVTTTNGQTNSLLDLSILAQCIENTYRK